MKKDFGFTKDELKIIKKLNTPSKIQDFLNSLEINFEEEGDTSYSPRTVLKKRKAHCVEGAVLAAAILRYHGQKPLILDLETSNDDFDHVIALFSKNGYWGAISKTNHAVLRYREPVYKTIRELVMSYFHEYFLNKNGKKTLRKYSDPVNLEIFDNKNWMTTEDEIWFIPEYLTKVPHKRIVPLRHLFSLRKADKIEIDAGKITEYKEKK